MSAHFKTYHNYFCYWMGCVRSDLLIEAWIRRFALYLLSCQTFRGDIFRPCTVPVLPVSPLARVIVISVVGICGRYGWNNLGPNITQNTWSSRPASCYADKFRGWPDILSFLYTGGRPHLVCLFFFLLDQVTKFSGHTAHVSRQLVL